MQYAAHRVFLFLLNQFVNRVSPRALCGLHPPLGLRQQRLAPSELAQSDQENVQTPNAGSVAHHHGSGTCFRRFCVGGTNGSAGEREALSRRLSETHAAASSKAPSLSLAEAQPSAAVEHHLARKTGTAAGSAVVPDVPAPPAPPRVHVPTTPLRHPRTWIRGSRGGAATSKLWRIRREFTRPYRAATVEALPAISPIAVVKWAFLPLAVKCCGLLKAPSTLGRHYRPRNQQPQRARREQTVAPEGSEHHPVFFASRDALP